MRERYLQFAGTFTFFYICPTTIYLLMLNIKLPYYGQIPYPGPIFKLVAAVISANIVILYEEKPPLLFILSNQGFYIASAISCVFAYIIIDVVFFLTTWLDFKFPWAPYYNKRLLLQFLLGVFAPVFPLFLGASLYFYVNNINVFETVYVKRYIPMIILLLTCLSAYLQYYWAKEKGFKKKVSALQANLNAPNVLSVDATTIAYLFAEDKNYYAVDFKGNKVGWELTIKETIPLLPSKMFFRINRSMVINRNAIEMIEVINPKQTAIFIKTAIYAGLSEAQKSGRITEARPSARLNTVFKRWYEEANFLRISF